jgi:glycine cleavage system transcriptional repressor
MKALALSVIGRDRPGIVSAVSRALLEHGVNIADSQMAILGGHFSMMILLEAPDGTELSGLQADLDQVKQKLSLDAVSLSEIDPLRERATQPSHVVTFYGADHPGIVHAVAEALAGREVNITDLDTHLVGEDGEPVYVMILEVSLPEGFSGSDLEELLGAVAKREKLELSVRALEQIDL